ncbi:MAG: hypothetical protein ACYTGZ_15985 [Planctomycetota bacterium]|jgi:hypothetical protein
MKRNVTTTLAVALLSSVALAGPKVKPSVNYAKTWEAAVAEAKLLNVPIVVHSHGFN